MKSIGNYEIIEVIAEHGPTLICVAKHKKLGRKTFLKIFKSADTTLLERFEREARVVADLNDKHIVAIYDFGEENGRYFISMEYVDGSNLKEYLDAHELSSEEIVEIAYKITKAVAVLHKHGYIHRDLKPENILVSKEGNVKLTDFGIAFHDSLEHVTTEGSLLGTPLYMSPEQINNLPVTPASDIFALGTIFYQMATKEHPFAAPRIGEIFSKILSQPVEDLCVVRPDMPVWFCRMVGKMLNKDPQARYSSAEELLAEFRKHHTFPPSTNVEKAPAPRKLPKAVFYLAGLGVFVLMLILGYRFARNMEQKPSGMVADTLNTKITNDSSRQAGNQITAKKDSLTMAAVTGEKTRKGTKPKNNIPDTVVKPPSIKYVNVKIQTYPWCKIYLNYQLVDSTPMIRPLRLKPGKYLIGLQNPLYPSFTDSITIPAKKYFTLSFNLDSIFARLDLQVLPWGRVYVDGKYIGETPLQKPIYVTREKHFIEVKNDYYVTWHDTLDFKGKSRIRKIISLKELVRK